MILQLNPSIPVNTPKGPGEAILIIDYGKEDDLLFTVFLDETGQCWTFNNKDIRAIKNVSIGRTTVEDPKVIAKCDEEYISIFKERDELLQAIRLNQEAFGTPNITIPTDESEEVQVGGVKIISDPNMKPGEWAIYGDPGGHTAKVVKGLYEEVKELNKWLSNLDFHRLSVDSEVKLVEAIDLRRVELTNGDRMMPDNVNIVTKELAAAIEKLKQHDFNMGLVEPTPGNPKRNIFKNLFWGYE